MAKVRNKAGMDLETHRGVVVADGVLEVPDDEVYNYTSSPNWEPVDKDATAAHGRGERAVATAVKGEAKQVRQALVGANYTDG